MSVPTQLIEEYLAGPATLRKAVSGLKPEQLKTRPVAGKWSTLEVVCHLVDFDPIYADRMKRIIAEEKPSILGADETKFHAALCYHDRDVEEELAILERTRSQMGRILKKLPESAWSRVGVHNEAGPLTLEQMLARVTKHITHHLAFVVEKRKALGLPA